MVFTLLLTAIEAPLVYALDITWGNYCIIVCVCGIINSLLLRRYVLILRKRSSWENGEPRFACHLFIWMASAAFILIGNVIEHDARADVHHSKTLDGLTFNEAEYFHIDSLPQLNKARWARNTKYNSYSKARGLGREHSYTGCYVAPFRGFGDVFYVVEHEYSRSTNNVPIPSEYTKEEIYENFQKEFNIMCDTIKPTVNAHLFQRLRPESDSYFWRAIDYSYLEDPIYNGISHSYRAVVLTPVKNGQMPRWTDKLPLAIILLALYFLLLLMVYTGSKTVPFWEDE